MDVRVRDDLELPRLVLADGLDKRVVDRDTTDRVRAACRRIEDVVACERRDTGRIPEQSKQPQKQEQILEGFCLRSVA